MARIVETETRYTTSPACRTADEMTEICCEASDALPCCEEVDPEWGGYSEEEVLAELGITLDDQGRDELGRYVEIRFDPREKPCGEMVTQYDLSGGNCCDEVEPIAWDDEYTPEVLPAGGSVLIYVTGGQAPYQFTVTNIALSFDDGRREWITDVPYARLHAGETFCGVAAVRIADGCGAVVREIRSDLGEWYYLGAICTLRGTPIQYLENVSGTYFHGVSVVGRYKQVCNMYRQQSDWGQSYRSAQYAWAPKSLSPAAGDLPCTYGCLGSGASLQGLCDCTNFDMDAAIDLCLTASPATAVLYEVSPVYRCDNSQQARWVQQVGGLGSWNCLNQTGWGSRYATFWYDIYGQSAYEWRCQ